ncbi:MAG: DMT family transporter [Mycobacterium sp.]|nr:DMT family transporter [Mycobacterium sp.]
MKAAEVRGSVLLDYLPLVAVWGGSYAVTEVALGAFTPAEVALWRAVIGASFLTVLLVAGGSGLPRLGRGGVVRIVALSILTASGQVSAAAAQLRMPSGMVAVLCSMTPLISVVYYWLRRTPIPSLKWVSVSLGVVGVAVLLSPTAHLDHLGLCLGLLAAAVFALAGILGADFFPDSTFSPTQLTVAQLAATAVLLAPEVAFARSPHAALTWPAVAAVLALGVLSAGIGNVLFWRVLRRGGPVLAGTTYQSVPVVAVITGVLVFDETLDAGEIIGMALVLTGLALLLPLVRKAAAGTEDPHLEEGLIGVHCEESSVGGNLEVVREEHAKRFAR